jgi:hypothetical protein
MPFISLLHAKLDLSRTICSRPTISTLQYPARVRNLHDAASLILPVARLETDSIAYAAATGLVDALDIDLTGKGSAPSSITNYIEQILDDPAKRLAWMLLVFIDDALTIPYDDAIDGVYVSALQHLQPVGLMHLIHAFNRQSYHINANEKNRLIDELEFADRALHAGVAHH